MAMVVVLLNKKFNSQKNESYKEINTGFSQSDQNE